MDKVLAGRQILVVEDEMMVLWNIEAVLADLGCRDVAVAATCEQAIALIRDRRFDVAMLDVNLGGETSYAAADVLACNGVPFLFSTGYGAHGIDVRFVDRPVIGKPYRDADLAAMLVALLPSGTEVQVG